MKIRIGSRAYTPSQLRKFGVALLAALGTLLSSAAEVFAPWLPHGAGAFLASAIALAGAVGVFLVRNAPLIDAADVFGADEPAGRHAADK